MRTGQGVAVDGIRKGQVRYLVEWADSADGQSYEDTWEPASLISKDLVRDFEAQRK